MRWRRVTFLRGETLIPELTTVGRSQQRQAVGGHLRPHCHPDAYEVVLITKGKVRWWVEAETVELEAGESIADIAMKCGFSSSQYFATVFKRYSGVTPSQHRRRDNGSKSPVVPIASFSL